MTDAFSPQKADLSGISPEATYVKFVRQAATLDVTKWGTVATAATAIGVEATAARAQTLTVTIDRPFLFVIRDTTTGAILFTAAVDDPTGAG
jgi:serpin B